MVAQCEKQEMQIARANQEKNDTVSASKEYLENLKREYKIDGSFGYDPITGEIK
jgi:hypothetical protein